MPTISVENYLKTIYKLETRGDDKVKTKEIADALEISLPSVTSMLKSLSDEGLVQYEKYRGVNLTDDGQREALKVIRKHRLVELFLVETLDYSWDEVHAEAERLEHAISDELATRMERYLSFPLFDPHGDPIPSADGVIAASEAVPLDKVEPGAHVTVERVMDQDPEVLRYLDRISLTPGSSCVVEEVLAFDGQMFLDIESHGATPLSHALATRILVVVS